MCWNVRISLQSLCLVSRLHYSTSRNPFQPDIPFISGRDELHILIIQFPQFRPVILCHAPSDEESRIWCHVRNRRCRDKLVGKVDLMVIEHPAKVLRCCRMLIFPPAIDIKVPFKVTILPTVFRLEFQEPFVPERICNYRINVWHFFQENNPAKHISCLCPHFNAGCTQHAPVFQNHANCMLNPIFIIMRFQIPTHKNTSWHPKYFHCTGCVHRMKWKFGFKNSFTISGQFYQIKVSTFINNSFLHIW